LKRLSFLIIYIIFLFFDAAPSFAYTGGVITGYSGANGGVSTPGYMIDNNLSTFSGFNKGGLADYSVNGVNGLERIYWKGDTNSNFHLVFYNGGNVVATIPTSSLTSGGYTSTDITSPVTKVRVINNTATTQSFTAYELELYEKQPPPAVPTLSTTSITYNSVTLKFQSNGAQTFEIYRDNEKLSEVPATQTTYQDNTVQSDTQYHYYVKAKNTVGSTDSQTITVNTPSPPPPSAVNITTFQASYDSVRLLFDAVTSAQTIKVYRDGVLIATLSGTATEYIDNAVEVNKAYQYWIVAENTGGATASGIIEVSTPDSPPPSNVNITLQPVTKKSVSLSFSATDAQTIKVYRDGTLLTTLPAFATSYTDETVEFGNSYQYWIVATNYDKSTASEIITATTPNAGKVANLRFTEKTTKKLSFAWDAEPTAEKYKVTITIKRKQTASLEWAASEPPETTVSYETTSTNGTISDVSTGDEVNVSVSMYNENFGYHGTSTTSTIVPATDIPNLENQNMGNASDVFFSAMSLAGNFWVFLMLGLCFFLAPFIYGLVKQATTSPKDKETKKERDIKREIRIGLREGK